MKTVSKIQEDKIVLVLTDFSKSAGNAADFALIMAEKFSANVLLFNSWFNPIEEFDICPVENYPILIQKSKEKLDKETQRLKSIMTENSSVFKPTISCISGEGTLIENARRLIEEKFIIMICMGGRKQSNEDYLFGTEINSILNTVQLPVVIVPEIDLKRIQTIS